MQDTQAAALRGSEKQIAWATTNTITRNFVLARKADYGNGETAWEVIAPSAHGPARTVAGHLSEFEAKTLAHIRNTSHRPQSTED